MSASDHPRPDHTDRARLIVTTARELAERQGRPTVTTRQLADHSQAGRYRHFHNKRDIISAVAPHGATELGTGNHVHPGLVTEVFWAALHGLANLTRTRRLPPEYAALRVELLVDRLATV